MKKIFQNRKRKKLSRKQLLTFQKAYAEFLAKTFIPSFHEDFLKLILLGVPSAETHYDKITNIWSWSVPWEIDKPKINEN